MAREYQRREISIPESVSGSERRKLYQAEYQRLWRQQHSKEDSYKERRKRYAKNDRKRNAGKIRARERQRNYGITQEEYDKLVAEQDRRCKICGRGGVLSVDHCHETGKVRGLLCRLCNVGLGAFRDSNTLLSAAISYLGVRQ